MKNTDREKVKLEAYKKKAIDFWFKKLFIDTQKGGVKC